MLSTDLIFGPFLLNYLAIHFVVPSQSLLWFSRTLLHYGS